MASTPARRPSTSVTPSWCRRRRDYLRFLRLLTGGGEVDGVRLLSVEHLRLMTTDQVPAAAKTPDSFFPGFWESIGWGFGVGIQLSGP